MSPKDLPRAALRFLAERHLATFTSLRPDGTPHVVPVGFTWEQERSLARVITSGGQQKARNAAAGGPVVICQAVGAQWISLEGTGRVAEDADSVADGVSRYAARYRQPRENPERVVIEVEVHRILGSVRLLGHGL